MTVRRRAVRRKKSALPKSASLAASSGRLLDSIVENIPDMIFVKDAENLNFVLFNRAGEDLLGYRRSELIGKNDYDFFPPVEAEFFTKKDREVLRSRRLLDIPEETIQTKSGVRYLHTKKIPLIDAKGRPTHLLGISEDITELRRARLELAERERRFVESQRLESIGRLAGGIAHEFNNVLMGITGLAQLIEAARPGTPEADDAGEIVAQGRRAAALVAQLLTYSRAKSGASEVCDLNAIAEGMRKMIAATLGAGLTVALEAAADPLWVLVDPRQVEQALLNLCLNSRDALGGEGMVRLTLSRVVLVEPRPAANATIPPGVYAAVSVADGGPGIPAELHEKIFEPFFTTKPLGAGSGLGLAVVFGAVRRFGGYITLESAPGRGATFTLYWPLASAPRPKPGAAKSAGAARLDGAETLLVADDDPAVRGVLTRALANLGYRVHAVSDGAQAVDYVRKGGRPPDLVLLDVSMPGMNGLSAYRELVRLVPGLKAVFMSGFAEASVAKEISTIGLPLLQKPFEPEFAAREIRRRLDAR
ncbi:MAG: ATP-binding protein [Elusimicrobiota bacterium]